MKITRQETTFFGLLKYHVCKGCHTALYEHREGNHSHLYTKRRGRGRRHYKGRCNFMSDAVGKLLKPTKKAAEEMERMGISLEVKP